MRHFTTPLVCFRLKKKSLFLVKTYGNNKEYLYRSFFGEVKLSDYFSLHDSSPNLPPATQQFLLAQLNELNFLTINESLHNLLVGQPSCVINLITTLVRNWTYAFSKLSDTSLDGLLLGQSLLVTKQKTDYKLVLKFLKNLYFGLNKGWHFDILLLNINYKILIYKKYNISFLHFFVGQSHAVILKITNTVFCSAKKRKKLLRIFSYNLWPITLLGRDIKQLRPVSKYKNKGIRYFGEHLIFKEGKAKQR